MPYPPQGIGATQAAVDATVGAHAALATVHQNAPALIDADIAAHEALDTIHQDAAAIAAALDTIHAAQPTPSTLVEVTKLAGATYDDLQDYINAFGDRSALEGGTVSDNGDGTAAIAAIKGWVKATDSETAPGLFFDWAGGNTPALADLMTSHVFLDYNEGTPQIVVATSLWTHVLKLDHILIATVYRDGATLHYHDHRKLAIDRANAINIHHLEEHPGHRARGLVVSDAGALALSIAEVAAGVTGVFYVGSDRHLAVVDGSGWSTLHYNFATSAWVETVGQAAIDNANYNPTGSGSGLAALTANRYAVHWVYVDLDGQHLHIVYGQGNYKANEAEEAAVPAMLPNIVTHYGLLIAKIIVQEGQTALIVLYPWTTPFTSSMATNHSDLANLAEDDHTQYALDTDLTDHAGVSDVHHSRYTDAEAVSAMGAKADANPLHHDQGGGGGGYTEGARLRHSTTQTIPNAIGAGTVLTFDTEDFDNDSMHDGVNPTRLTFTTAGVYILIGQCYWIFRAVGARMLFIRHSTLGVTVYDIRVYGNTFGPAQTVSTLLDVVAGTFITLEVYQNSGIPLQVVNTGYAGSVLSAHRVG